jgi:hypothetical protein
MNRIKWTPADWPKCDQYGDLGELRVAFLRFLGGTDDVYKLTMMLDGENYWCDTETEAKQAAEKRLTDWMEEAGLMFKEEPEYVI